MAKENLDNSSFKEFKKAVRDKKLGQLYIFHGNEKYLMEYYLGEMKNILLGGGMEGFNYHPFDGKDLNIDSLSSAVLTLPVFSDRTLIVVRDFNIFKCEEKQKEKLEELLSDLPEYVCLVFIYDTIEFSPKKQKISEIIEKKGNIVKFDQQKQEDLIVWIKRRFSALGREIDNADAEYLIYLSGGLMSSLIPEIEKIAAYSAGKIKKSDIDAVVIPVMDAIIFELTDAISERNFKKSWLILSELLKMKEDPIYILSFVGKQVRQMYSAKLALDRGKDAAYVSILWGIKHRYPAQLLLRSAKRITAEWCREAIKLCAETDFILKTSAKDKERELELFLLKLGGIGGAA